MQYSITKNEEYLLADKPPVSRAYLVGLNSLRAVAALSVCLYHFTNGALPKLVIPALGHVFARGWVGVEIFFVISGFIIPYSLLGKGYHLRNFGSYLLRRVIRINPTAYVALLLVLGQWFFIDYVIQHNHKYTGGLSVGQVFHNMLFTIPFTEYHWVNGVFWTLAVEFEFYLVVGLGFRLMFERHHVGWLVLVYLLLFAGQWLPLPGLAKQSLCLYSPLFAIGSLALLWQQRRFSLPVYVGLLLLFGLLTYYKLGFFVAAVGLGTAVAIGGLRVAVPGLDLVGRMSYSFYLLHVLLGTTTEFLTLRLFTPHSDLQKLLVMLLALAVALLGSYCFYYVVERPFMRLAASKK